MPDAPSRAPFLLQLGASLLDRVRRGETHERILASVQSEVPTGVDLYFVRRGARTASAATGRDARLRDRVLRILDCVA